jgi:hypothetical protein
MSTRIFPFILLASACSGSGNRYNQGYDLGSNDTDDTDSNAQDDTGSGNEGGDEGSDEGSDEGGQGGDEGSADGDDGGDGAPDYCHNMYHPIHESGWNKTYYAVYNDVEAEAATYGLSPISTEEGSETFQYRDVVSAGEESYDVTLTVSCDPSGQEGMFVTAWSGDVNTVISDLLPIAVPYSVDATLTSPRQYLPPEYALGAVGTWDYAYTLNITASDSSGGGGTPSETVYQVEGTFAEVGFEDFTLYDGTTVEAYKLTNSYTMTESGLFGDTVTTGYIEQHFVRGLGLVKEKHSDSENGSIILLKSLTSYSGLEIAE